MHLIIQINMDKIPAPIVQKLYDILNANEKEIEKTFHLVILNY